MTIVNEEWDHEKYFQIVFVEFLEMIGRVAELAFHDTDIDTEPLPRKIEYVLDALFQIIDFERQEPVIEELDETESDHEY
jgi:hypothetical protein